MSAARADEPAALARAHRLVEWTPPPCKAGSRVAIIFPSGPANQTNLNDGVGVLRSWGLVPVLFDRVSDCCDNDRVDQQKTGQPKPPPQSYLAANDSERAMLFERAFADPSIDAVICARGGYGALRLLDLVDWAAIAPHSRRKRFYGFSDATVLHSALWTQHSQTYEGETLVTFHSPMPAAGRRFCRMTPLDAARMKHALFAESIHTVLTIDGGVALEINRAETERISCSTHGNDGNTISTGQMLYGAKGRGRARCSGMLIGGNLTTLVSMLGSRWAWPILTESTPLWSSKNSSLRDVPVILAVEDTHETAIRIDRLLAQLNAARGCGNHDRFEWLAGIVIGSFYEKDDTWSMLGNGAALGGMELLATVDDSSVQSASTRGANVLTCCCPIAKGRRQENHAAPHSRLLQHEGGACTENSRVKRRPAIRATKGPFKEWGRMAASVDAADNTCTAEAYFWREVIGLPAQLPVMWGCDFGHGRRNATLPFGCYVHLDPQRGVLQLPLP